MPGNGSILSETLGSNYTSVVTFECVLGFELNGAPAIECLSTENWNDTEPTCDPIGK